MKIWFWRRRHKRLIGIILILITLYGLKRLLYSSHVRLPTDVNRPWGRSDQPCQHPQLELNSSLLVPFFHQVRPLQCRAERNWVCVEGSKAHLCPWAPGKDTHCRYTFLQRKTDHYNVEVAIAETTGPAEIELKTDFFRVQCHENDAGSSGVWRNAMAGIAENAAVTARTGYEKLPKDSANLNFLMFGYDSISRLTFMRKLPKTYQYLQESLGSVVLHSYNIVGDGTPQALIPILTGKTEPELPETRKRKIFASNYVDVYPFVWKEFSRNGYVTAFSEDMPKYSAFTYRLTGFNEQPTDHYLRPFYIDVDQVKSYHPELCLGDTPRHKVLMNWIENFYDHYASKPKFLFAFHGELSHDDINNIELADEDMLQFLKSLKRKGHLENTLLIVMSDHGHRFADIRETLQGKYEERLPFFSITVPESFKSKYPSAWANLQKNADRLTSPFDIHPTIRSLLHFKGGGLGNITHRSISLFDEVPLLRSCQDAGIEPHWCTCLNWGKILTNDSIVVQGATVLVDYINGLTLQYRELCAPLRLHTIIWAERYAPSLGLLRFNKNADYDGFEGDFSADTKLNEEFYQVKFQTSPGDGRFEATIRYMLTSKTFQPNIDGISRVNKYGNNANCIQDINADLRKFCYCQ